jgi:hypothetical protein
MTTPTDWRALCAELLEALKNAIRVIYNEDGTKHISTADHVISKADTALAQSEPQGPTDDAELRTTYAIGAEARWREGFSEAWSLTDMERAAHTAGLRAVLTRYPRPTVQPEPVADGEVAEIVAELREIQDCFDIASGMEGWGPVITRAADLLERLAQPEPQGPIPEAELAAMWNQQADSFNQWESLDSGEQLAWAQARALARFGRPAIKPVPVSERLPGPEDCDAEGRCWWGVPAGIVDPDDDDDRASAAGWVLVAAMPHATHWRPHHALPVPTLN